MKTFAVALMSLLLSTGVVRAERINVAVSIPPQAYLVQQLAGDHADIAVLVPDGKSPHDYSPTPRQMRELAACRLYFMVGGMPFESEIVKKIRAGLHAGFVNSSEGVKFIPAAAGEHHHHHGEGEENAEAERHHHHESGDDPHIWMDPVNLKIMAGNMLAALVKADPADKAVFQANYRQLADRLDALNRAIAERLAPFRGRSVYVYHPAFGYFCARYGLIQVAIEEGGKDPSPQQIMALIAAARHDNIHVILVQKQFNSRSAARIGAAIKGRVVPVDNLARNVPEMLENLTQQIVLGLSGK